MCTELEYHPYLLAHLDRVVTLHKKYNIVAQSFGPLTPVLRHPTGGPVKPILEKIAQRLSKETGKSVDTTGVLLLWTIQKGVVAVTASKTPANLKRIVETEELPDLTAEEVEEIEQAGRKVHFMHYDVSLPDNCKRYCADLN
jgi:diketogulonate reductase-like aldo/keto reductase